MKNKVCMAITAWLFGFLLIHSAHAEIDWDILRTLEIGDSPVDIALSPNGSRIFVLTKNSQLQVYDIEGRLMGQMPVGPDVNQINTIQREDIVFLSSSKGKTIQVVMVDLIRQINVSGSPYLGAAEAPITVAVFSDFE